MNRRDFLIDAATMSLSAAAAAGAIGEPLVRIQAAARADDSLKGPPITCAVVGASLQGREILSALSRMSPFAPIAYVCDTYSNPGFDKRWKAIAPSSKYTADYRQVIDDKSVQAVFVATPSHKHKQIVLDAIAAGKHVYCEAPLASDVADAKAIAQAGKAAKTVFQCGLQQRCNMQHKHVLKFIKGGDLGIIASGRAQWNKRTSWRFPWQDPARQAELNWRLSRATSSGLIGEIGIHSLDTATWVMKEPPIAVSGMGGIQEYNDGRDVYDTVVCTLEYPKNRGFQYSSTLCNSFDDTFELFFGSTSAIELRDLRAWMYMEPDAPVLGWQGYARQDDLVIGDLKTGTGLKIATGIALVADATKQLALSKTPGVLGTDLTKSALFQAIREYLDAVRTGAKSPVSAELGYQATVVANKANEAATTGSRIVFKQEWFEV